MMLCHGRARVANQEPSSDSCSSSAWWRNFDLLLSPDLIQLISWFFLQNHIEKVSGTSVVISSSTFVLIYTFFYKYACTFAPEWTVFTLFGLVNTLCLNEVFLICLQIITFKSLSVENLHINVAPVVSNV